MRKIALLIAFIFGVISIQAQTALPVAATGNVLVNGTGASNSSIASTATVNFKLAVNGAFILWGTGTNTVTSPSIYLRNTTATTGRIWAFNSDNTGIFTISDATGTTAPLTHTNRFILNAAGNAGLGTIANPATFTSLFTLGSTAANSKLAVWDNGTIRSGMGWATGQLRLHLSATTDKFSFLSTEAATTDLMTILGTGNVGIGIAAPLAQLHTTGTLRFDKFKNNAAGDSVLTTDINGNVAFRKIAATIIDSSKWTLSGSNIFNKNTGNVGIGTTTPGSKLEINNATAGTSGLRFTQLTSASALAASNGKVLTVDASGNVILAKDSLGAAATAWNQNGNTVGAVKTIGTIDNFDLPVITGNTEKMRVTSAGNLGIGIVAPLAQLHTTSTVRFDKFKNNAAGDSVLTTDVNGNVLLKKLVVPAAIDSSKWTLNGANIFNKNSGNVGIGTNAPANKLSIAAASAGNSGLQFTQLTSSSAALASNGKTLSVDGSGNVILVKDSIGAGAAGWNLGGNTVGAVKALGTVDNFDLPFVVNNFERMRLTASGKLGIGTTTPNVLANLDVINNARVSNSFWVDRTGGNLNNYFGITARGSAEASNFGNAAGNGAVEITANQTSGLIVGTTSASDVVFGTANAERARISATGNVGIGTNNPLAQLHNTGTIRFDKFKNNAAGDSVLTTDVNGNVLFKRLVLPAAPDSSKWTLSGTNIFNKNTGNVGIGTATPGYKLDVNGSSRFYDSLTITKTGATGTLQTWRKADVGAELGKFESIGDAAVFTLGYYYLSNNRIVMNGGTFGGASNIQLFQGASSQNIFITSSGNSFFNGGNFGIGTSNPLAQLHSTGTVRFDNFKNNAAGDSVLTTDVNGNVKLKYSIPYIGNGWNYNGNTVGAIKNFGTTDNFDLPFITNNTERMRITAGGSVLVNGPVSQSAGNFNFGNGLIFDTYPNFSAARIFGSGTIVYQSNSPGNQHYFANQIGTAFTGNLVTIDPGGYPALADQQLSLKVLGKNGALGLNVNMLGNTGIGTITPASKLDVKGSVNLDNGAGAVFNMNAASGIINMTASNAQLTVGNESIAAFMNSTGSFDISKTSSLYFRVANNGNILAGTSTDNGNKLQVNGNLWSTGLIIPTGAAAGKVLTSDSAGNASWQNSTGGVATSGWALNGNAGTTPNTNFLGTTDDKDFVFKRNNVLSGFLNDASYNTYYGVNAGNVSSTGIMNVFIGHTAGKSNTTGGHNLFVGYYAGGLNTTGNYNAFSGFNSGGHNTTGSYNTYTGQQSGAFSTTGNYNVFNGYGAGISNVSGSNNIFSGHFSGLNNSSGSFNTIIGDSTGTGITTGSYNTILGANVTGLPANFSYNIIIADGAGRRRINIDSTGNVGIGTAAPAAKLHTIGTLRFEGLASNSSLTNVLVADASGNIAYRDATTLGGSSSSSWSVSGSNIFNANSGLVLIGSAVNPMPSDTSLRLAVSGNIYAKKLKITQTGWADYVFDPAYKLRSLHEVETFIKANQHLPELPSAAEVAKAGIDVGDNQTVLLKKVEELTLYAIEQNKKQEAQQQIIDEQMKMLQQMKAEIEKLQPKKNKK